MQHKYLTNISSVPGALLAVFQRAFPRTTDSEMLREKGLGSGGLMSRKCSCYSFLSETHAAQQDFKTSEKFRRRKANRIVLNPGFSHLI